MRENKDISYIYDGTYNGLLTCVFTCYEDKFIPAGVLTDATLLPSKRIYTDKVKAARVARGVARTMGSAAENMIRNAYLSDFKDKELAVIRFIVRGMAVGISVCRDLAHPDVARISEISRAVGREARMCLERLKFSLISGVLVSVVQPTHNILPLIGRHFVGRFPNEDFFIYDNVHKQGVTYAKGKLSLAEIDDFTPGDIDDEEELCCRLWKIFYDTVEIKPRRNEKLMKQHMPRRYANM